jgi:hypothetical protein
MSAAARPKRWGMSRRVKSHGLKPNRIEISTLLNGLAMEDTWGNLGRQKGNGNNLHNKGIKYNGSDMIPTTDITMTSPYLKDISLRIRAYVIEKAPGSVVSQEGADETTDNSPQVEEDWKLRECSCHPKHQTVIIRVPTFCSHPNLL